MVLAAAVVVLALVPATASAIVGGTTPNRAWPAQGYVEVALPGGGVRVCGGTLVSGRWLLTAGHCVTERAPSTIQLAAGAFTVNLGETDTTLFGGPDRFAVDDVVRDPLFARRPMSASHDLALLHLATAPPATRSLEPMRIVTAAEAGLWSPGTVATVIGWGAMVAGGTRPTQLQQAGVPIRDDATCAAAYPATDPNPFDVLSMLCAGDGSADTCTGDSGGPLMVPRGDDFALAGVTSYGAACADPAHPGIYARAGAPDLNTWVRAHIPTADIAIDPARPNPGENVTLTATGTQPQPAPRVYAWDLDDDGAFDDASGATTAMPARGGSTVVRVQESYPDGDRAVAREVVTTAGSPLPQPPPPPPPPPRPAAAAAPTAAAAPAPASAAPDAPAVRASSLDLPPLARLLRGARSARIASLLDGRATIRVQCFAACTLRARLTLDGATAKALGLSRTQRSTLIGTGARTLRRAGSITLTIHLTRHAVGALRRATGGTARIRVTARAGTRVQRLERTIALRG